MFSHPKKGLLGINYVYLFGSSKANPSFGGDNFKANDLSGWLPLATI